MSDLQAIIVGKWSTAYARNPRAAILRFDFIDRPPITLAMHPEDAIAMAKAILEQENTPPPTKAQMS